MKDIPSLNFISVIILFGVLQAVLLAFIFFQKKCNHSKLLGSILLALTLIELESFLNYSGLVKWFPWLINVSPTLILTIGPLSYLYVTHNGRLGNSPTRRWAHFLPALLYFGYSFFFFLQSDAFKIHSALKSYHPEWTTNNISLRYPIDPLDIQGFVVIEGLSFHLLTYGAICFWFITNSHQGREHKSTLHLRFSVAWSIALIAGGLLFLLTGGVVNGSVLYKPMLPEYVVNVYTVVLVYGVSAFWLSQIILTESEKAKYAKSAISSEFQVQKLAQLKEIMLLQKPYKSHNFSLGHLAELTNLSSHHVSQIINTGTGMSFHDFVNRYRIEEAKVILTQANENPPKLESLAYELGYKSKSAFFSSFKKQTEMTPSRFRESTLNS